MIAALLSPVGRYTDGRDFIIFAFACVALCAITAWVEGQIKGLRSKRRKTKAADR